ncbi:MAG: replication factor C large subunit, partial [Nanoarchaeota archaeon]
HITLSMDNRSVPWTSKYAPMTVETVPQPAVVKDVLAFMAAFPKRRALLLVGPSGVGKTALVCALAAQQNLEIVETNASDFRTADEIEAKVGGAARQASLFGTKKLILVDEIDGISGTKDRGGIPALVKIIEKTAFPMILTASDISDKRYNPIAKLCSVVTVPPVEAAAAAAVLAGIAKAESVRAEDLLLKSMARRCGGDLRAAINDFQAITEGPRVLSREMIDELASRDKDESIQPALVKVLKTTDASLALGAFDAVDMDLNECMLWLDYNMGKEYTKPADLERAFNALSRADMFMGRIRRWQHWRFLVYVSDLMTAGVACAKDAKYPGLQKYDRTSRLLKIWQANMRNTKRNAIAEKLALATHTSKRRVIQDVMPFMRKMCEADEKKALEFATALELDDDQVEWLTS